MSYGYIVLIAAILCLPVIFRIIYILPIIRINEYVYKSIFCHISCEPRKNNVLNNNSYERNKELFKGLFNDLPPSKRLSYSMDTHQKVIDLMKPYIENGKITILKISKGRMLYRKINVGELEKMMGKPNATSKWYPGFYVKFRVNF